MFFFISQMRYFPNLLHCKKLELCNVSMLNNGSIFKKKTKYYQRKWKTKYNISVNPAPGPVGYACAAVSVYKRLYASNSVESRKQISHILKFHTAVTNIFFHIGNFLRLWSHGPKHVITCKRRFNVTSASDRRSSHTGIASRKAKN